jgi:polyhydroxybutyrate depolymerase
MRLAGLAVAVLLTATACTSSDPVEDAAEPAPATATAAPTTAPTSTPAPTPTSQPSPRPGCSGTTLTPGVEARTIVTTDGLERSYRLALPDAVTAGEALPLLFNFHGFTGSAEQQALVSGWENRVDEIDMIVVHPQGTGTPEGNIAHWNLQSGIEGVDDVAFVTELLDQLLTELCIDHTRVYSMGLSNGGYFSALLACRMADRFAAIATVAAIMHVDDCAPSRPVPVLAIHGTDDRIVPFEGGESTLTDTGLLGGDVAEQRELQDFFAMSMPEEVAQWAATDGCAVEPTVTTVSEHVDLTTYTGCDADAEVLFYVVDGGGHTWPSSAVMAAVEGFVGVTTFEIDATTLASEFFSRH